MPGLATGLPSSPKMWGQTKLCSLSHPSVQTCSQHTSIVFIVKSERGCLKEREVSGSPQDIGKNGQGWELGFPVVKQALYPPSVKKWLKKMLQGTIFPPEVFSAFHK